MTAHNLQRIDRLTPLAEAIVKLKAITKPVALIELDIGESMGLALAADLKSPRSIPDVAIALRDGWAVRADAFAGAEPYAPLPLEPAPMWIDAGNKLPDGTDSIAPLEAVSFAGGAAQAVAQIFPGENVLQPGDFAREGAVLRAKGLRLRATDIATATLGGVIRATIRKPRIALLRGGERDVSATLRFLAQTIAGQGGSAEIVDAAFGKFAAGNSEYDAVIAAGGTGSGKNDGAVVTLAARGKVAVHGIAIAPGETSAIGELRGKPIVLVPGRFDAALAAWLVLGRPLLDALAAADESEASTPVTLSSKIASAPGITEVVPLRCDKDKARPLATGVLSLEAISNADGWVLVPPESEGFAEGTIVAMRPLP